MSLAIYDLFLSLTCYEIDSFYSNFNIQTCKNSFFIVTNVDKWSGNKKQCYSFICKLDAITVQYHYTNIWHKIVMKIKLTRKLVCVTTCWHLTHEGFWNYWIQFEDVYPKNGSSSCQMAKTHLSQLI